MANSFVCVHLHIVFAVKNRDAILADEWRDELFRYIGGVIRKHNQVPVIVGGWRDHVHILVGANATINIANLVKDIKLASHSWIQSRMRCKFSWQDGYGCFSISSTHVDAAVYYIKKQPQHHAYINMVDEFRELLLRNNVVFDERYLPKEVLDC